MNACRGFLSIETEGGTSFLAECSSSGIYAVSGPVRILLQRLFLLFFLSESSFFLRFFPQDSRPHVIGLGIEYLWWV